MDTLRHGLALVLVVVLSPLLLYWFLIHPSGLRRLWRRIGLLRSYLLIATPIVMAGFALFRARRTLLAADYGTNPVLVALGGICLIVSYRWRRRISRTMGGRVIAGIPELDPDGHPVPLITDGLHARIRHPRYVQFALAMIGYAFIANHLASYAAVLAWIAAILVIVPLEERELAGRFGSQYEDYRRRVPRFIPRTNRR